MRRFAKTLVLTVWLKRSDTGHSFAKHIDSGLRKVVLLLRYRENGEKIFLLEQKVLLCEISRKSRLC